MSESNKTLNQALAPLIKIGVGSANASYESMAEAFRSVLDHTTETIAIINLKGRLYYINKVENDLDRKAIIGTNYYKSFNSEDAKKLIAKVKLVAKNKYSESCYLEREYGGEISVLECSINPLIRNNEVYAITIISRDISDEVKHKYEALEYQERLKLALSRVEVGIWELNLKTNAVICDPLVLEIYNLKNFDGSWEAFSQGIHDEDVSILSDAITEAKITRDAFEIEYRLLVNEETVFVLNKASVLVDAKNVPTKIIGVCQDITHLRKEDLGAMNSIISAQEKERVRLGKELHDGIGQLLSAARMNLNALSMEVESGNKDLINQLDKVKALISEAAEETRNISHTLVPGRVNELGLMRGIKNLCGSYSIKNMKFEFESNLDVHQRYDEIIELNFYRITQELITNAIKHSKASEIYVLLNSVEERLELEVRDDGIGLGNRYSENNIGIGLDNVVSRVNYLNGNISIDSVPNRGTSIKVECVPELIEKAL